MENVTYLPFADRRPRRRERRYVEDLPEGVVRLRPWPEPQEQSGPPGTFAGAPEALVLAALLAALLNGSKAYRRVVVGTCAHLRRVDEADPGNITVALARTIAAQAWELADRAP
jgi:hypothetical protein